MPFTLAIPRRPPSRTDRRETGLLKHSHPSECLWAILECMFQVLHDSLLPYSLFYPPLCLNVVWVGVECLDLALSRQFDLTLPFLQLP